MRVAVVGSGIVGLSTAWQLAGRGHGVTVFEQFEPGHERGSSHGRSRIVRKAYPDVFYTQCMTEGYPMWAELAARLGHDLVHEVGLLYFGSRDSIELISVASALQVNEVPHEILSNKESARVFPELHLTDDEVGIWTPEAGWVEADTACFGLRTLAATLGAEFVHGQVADREQLERDFDAYVVCAGAWITDWVPIPITVTAQTYALVKHHQRGPVWIEDSDDFCYGFPTETDGFKIGVHRPGPAADPRLPERPVDEDALAAICDTARRRFGVANPELTGITRCLYSNSANEDFVFGEIGQQGFFVSSCSGHGFKFGPWVGRRMADFVDRKDSPSNWPRFYWRGSE